ncbi:hypothetical protein D3C72_1795150 [compost metagenome]
MPMRVRRSTSISIVSCWKVFSLDMDFCSRKGTTSESSSPLALRQMLIPFSPRTFCIVNTSICCKVPILEIPILRSKVKDFSPTMGILRMDSGARKPFSVPFCTCFSPQGLAVPVAIFETVLLTERPKLIGSPVSLIMRWRSSCVHFQQPKKRSIPDTSR